ncbi:MAG TPA: hypothetical protein VFM10_05875 [Terriglobales bacterium]|nr:hypothetical protein [Terriglobales bacterium]
MYLRLGGPVIVICLLVCAAATAQTKLKWSDIDQQSGWQACSTCAGGQNSSNNFSGPTRSISPSLDGWAAKFSINSPWPKYANVFWWRQELAGAGDHTTIAGLHNFTYDLWYYIKQPSYSQALEFDVTQTICDGNCTSGTSTRYIYGHECNNLQTRTWRVWDSAGGKWVDTGIACKILPYQWIHLVFQTQRTSDNKVLFVTLSVNGKTYYINKTFSPKPLSVQADDLNADFQMDGDSAGHPYSTWLDKMNLTAW